jgi:CRP/FNR family transcriptional regulator, cyclic AMP receptor protein
MVGTNELQSVPLFSALPEEQLSALATRVTVERFRRNAVILHYGSEEDGLRIILSGRAKVLIPSKGRREVILSLLAAGDFFGEMTLLDGKPRSANVIAQEPCMVLSIGKADFMQCTSGNFELTMRIAGVLVTRLRAAQLKIAGLAMLDVRQRVARVLLDLAENGDGKYLIRSAPSRNEIADMVGATRKRVSDVMKKLQSERFILIDKRRIELLCEINNMPRLQQVLGRLRRFPRR